MRAAAIVLLALALLAPPAAVLAQATAPGKAAPEKPAATLASTDRAPGKAAAERAGPKAEKQQGRAAAQEKPQDKAKAAAGREFLLGLLTQADDPRYDRQALEKAWPEAPWGRAQVAMEIALDDASFTLQGAGYQKQRVVAAEAADAQGVAEALAGLQRQGVRHVVLELPAASVAAAAAATRGQDLILYNAAAPEDALRGAQCAPHLLHTLPSHAMQADALAQFLVARKWGKLLVLHGMNPPDRLLLAAFQRSAKRFGARAVAERAFKLSNDPRERDLANVRLLTTGAEYDAVVVLDADGEFARDLPYRTMLARPVVGSNGLTAQAWSAWYERHGAPQLSRRFQRKAGRPMGSYDWAAWMAARAAGEAASRDARATTAQQLQWLRGGDLALDGYKGQRLSFRAWDGQLRQPLLLAHGNGLAETAPIEGFLHAKTVLDTLGHDAPETACRP